MVKASQRLVPILVDRSRPGAKEIAGKYDVKLYPTVVFTDPEGKELARLEKRSAEAVIKKIDEVCAQLKGSVSWTESWARAVGQAKDGKKPVVCLFGDDKDDSKKLEEALGDASLKDIREKLVFVKGDLKSDEARRFEVSGAPVLLIVDPNTEKPLQKIAGRKTAAELKKEFEESLRKFDAGK